MNLKRALYFFAEADGRVRQVINGVVTSISQVRALQNSPIGHQDVAIMWKRNEELWGQVRNFSLPLGFPNDSALITRNDGYRFNPDRELYLIIKWLVCEVTDDEFQLYYKSIYRGRLDFSTLHDLPQEYRTSMNIMEGGASRLLKAAFNTEFYIPFDTDAVTVKMDGTRIEGKYNAIPDNGTSPSGTFYFKNHLVGLQMVQGELGFIGSVKSVQRQQVSNMNTGIKATGGWFFKATVTGDIDITYNIDVVVEYTPAAPAINPAAQYSIVIRKIDSTGTGTNLHTLLSRTAGDGIPGDYHLESAATISVNETDELYLYAFCTVEGASGDDQIRTIYNINQDTVFTAKYFYRHPTTYCKAFSPYQLYLKLCAKAGILAVNAVSTLLQQSTYYFTSGDGIRQIDDTGVKITWADFFLAIDTWHMAGLSTQNDTITIEGRRSFFQTDNPVIFSQAKVEDIWHNTDWLYSSIKVGHAEPEVDAVNGKYAFNATHIYKTPVKAGGGKVLEIISPVRCDPFEIETLRRETEGQTTTDTTKDNRAFAIDVDPSPPDPVTANVSFLTGTPPYIIGYLGADVEVGVTIQVSGTALNNGQYKIIGIGSVLLFNIYYLQEINNPVQNESGIVATVTFVSGFTLSLDRSVIPDSGVPDPESIYNVRLRPSEILRHHYQWIRSYLWNYTGKIIFEQATRNADLTVNGVKDGHDINIQDMGDLLFIPKFMKATVPTDITLSEILEDNINTPATIPYAGNNYSGFIWEAGVSPESEEPQVCQILLFPDTDIEKLIV